ncbi:MAG TPA: efflux RND transporter periplasmic adaptor subunit [Desulfobacteria bacterium]|nr:efflux RND transporter periplasmic adaptor subunit [Desulfobacteria bacterium]
MKAVESGRRTVSLSMIVLVTVILTLLLGGGAAYLLGYFKVPVSAPVEQASHGSNEHSQKAEQKTATSDAKKGKVLYWRAPMNPTEIYDKPGKSAMGMDLVPVYAGETSRPGEVRIDPVIQQDMGVRMGRVKKGPLIHVVRTYGIVTPDETLTAQINLKTSGWIEKIYVDFTGKHVKKGDPLFELYSPELVAAQEGYLAALKTSGKPGTGNDRLLDSARNRLRYFDVPEEFIERLKTSHSVKMTVMIRSPLNGYVIQRNAEEGSYVQAGRMVFQIADLRRVWVDAHVYEYELDLIETDQQAEMTLPSLPGRTFTGTVAFEYPYLQPKTRDLVVRLVFENPEMELKPEMYADVRIKTVLRGEGLMIPSEAVIRTGKRNLVFLSIGDGKFVPRDVILGPLLVRNRVQVIAGLSEGESVVTSGQFLLDSESNLNEALQKMIDRKVEEKAKKDGADFFSDME